MRDRRYNFKQISQLEKFPINDSFWSNFEPVEISQKFNFLPTDYDSRKFLKAFGMHRGLKHSNGIFKKFLTANSVSTKCHFSCREQLIYAINMLLSINFQKIKMDLFSSCINVKPTVNWILKYVVFPHYNTKLLHKLNKVLPIRILPILSTNMERNFENIQLKKNCLL